MTIKNNEDNILLQVNDYGDAGTLFLPPFAIFPILPINSNMLLNFDGTLYWNGSALGTSTNAGGWTKPPPGLKIYTSDLTNKVGIGTSNPQSILSVGDEGFPNTAVYGSEKQTGNVVNFGGYFEAAGDDGTGVHGFADGISGFGVLGVADGENGHGIAGYSNGVNGRGVVGDALGANAFAGYF
ncbi:MAG: hypothetical protein H6613_18455 [Ignavibacteriales bacterium]|nr:hypothetical protein [Ignavibacteriales bacterium]